MAAAKAEWLPVVAKPATMRVYVTFLAGAGEDQLEGVVGLGKVGSAHPLVVAVLPGVPVAHRSILVSQGCTVREVEPVFPPPLENPNPSTVAFDVTNYSKLRIWEVLYCT
jgi:inositol 3-alpha-galactosyltransferase